MCGIPASGKTTLSKQLASENHAVLYCYDKLPNAYQTYWTHLSMFRHIAQDLKNNRPVVCDDLHTTKKSRSDLLKAISDIDCQKILHVMRVPTDVCIKRIKEREKWNVPANVVTSCYNNYEEPTIDEGWDEIIYHEYVKE